MSLLDRFKSLKDSSGLCIWAGKLFYKGGAASLKAQSSLNFSLDAENIKEGGSHHIDHI